MFGQVRRHADMAEWGRHLVAQPDEPDLRLGTLVSVQGDQPIAAGAFGMDERRKRNAALMTYDAAILEDFWRLVAVFAHELAHLRRTVTRDRGEADRMWSARRTPWWL